MTYGEPKIQDNEGKLEERLKELAEEKVQLSELERQVAVSQIVSAQQQLNNLDLQMKINLMRLGTLQMVGHHDYFKRSTPLSNLLGKGYRRPAGRRGKVKSAYGFLRKNISTIFFLHLLVN